MLAMRFEGGHCWGIDERVEQRLVDRDSRWPNSDCRAAETRGEMKLLKKESSQLDQVKVAQLAATLMLNVSIQLGYKWFTG